mmetsp:Transcript_65158/g.127936  ORF Transcript_65158/g.127936 Transcript_65158/m.127936 type:complete len:241 (+) Transcript_65158:616-1338(+)
MLSTADAPLSLALSAMSFSKKSSRKRGKLSSRSVCPVGAVSMMTRSNRTPSPACCCTRDRTLLKATSSSKPGGAVSNTSAKSPMLSCPKSPCPSLPLDDVKDCTSVLNSATDSSVSTSRAYRQPPLSPPMAPVVSTSETGVSCPFGSFTPRASPKLCAGSVDTTTVEKPPCSAHATARAAEVEVLPTPPFPPTTTNRWPGHSDNKSSHFSLVEGPLPWWLLPPASWSPASDSRSTDSKRP